MACHCVLPTNRLCWIKSHSQTCPLWQHHHWEERSREKSMTAEQSQNVLSWKDPQGSSDVTLWISVPFRHHLYLELHSNNSIHPQWSLFCPCLRTLNANPNLGQETTHLWLKCVTASKGSRTATSQKKSICYKWATQDMTFGDSSLW